MSLFNMLIGLVVGIIILIPYFFIRVKWLKHVFIVFALVGVGIGAKLSQSYLYPYYLGWEFERDIKKEPLFALVAKEYPQAFAEFIQKVKKGLHRQASLQEVSLYSSELMNKIFYQHLQTAPEEVTYLYLKSTIELYRYLYTKDPSAVVLLELGAKEQTSPLQKIWDDKTFKLLFNNLLETKKLLIEDSIQTPAKLPDAQTASPMLDKVVQDLAKKFGDKNVRAAFSDHAYSLPAQLVAPIIIGFYSEILAQGKEPAAIIMRYIAVLKSKALIQARESAPAVPAKLNKE